jgi:hypothetical protein
MRYGRSCQIFCSVTYFGFCRARQIAGIMIPTRSMITRISAIFQPHVTGAIEANGYPKPDYASLNDGIIPSLDARLFL